MVLKFHSHNVRLQLRINNDLELSPFLLHSKSFFKSLGCFNKKRRKLFAKNLKRVREQFLFCSRTIFYASYYGAKFVKHGCRIRGARVRHPCTTKVHFVDVNSSDLKVRKKLVCCWKKNYMLFPVNFQRVCEKFLTCLRFMGNVLEENLYTVPHKFIYG